MTYKEVKIDDIVSWIKSHAESRNKSAILIEIDDTISSVTNALLAKKTGLAVHVIIYCVHSDWQSIRDLCENLKFDYHRLDPDYDGDDVSETWIPEDCNDVRIKYIRNVKFQKELEKYAKIAYIAETTNSLLLSNITRDDYLFVRNYPKINPWDIMPFADLSMAMVNGLFDKLAPIRSPEIEAFYNIAPKPNLEIEWLYNANEKSRIIESESDPTKHQKWYIYTTAQKSLIAKVHQIEKLTRYKQNSIPVFKREMLDNK